MQVRRMSTPKEFRVHRANATGVPEPGLAVSWIMTIIHHHGKNDAGQRVASLTGASVFDIMRAPRGAAPLIRKPRQTTDAEALR
jgi:hypothetical protein